MRALASIVALLVLASTPAEADAEKIGLQSVRGTGDRVGVQSETETREPLGLVAEADTDGKVGLQTEERAMDKEVADELWRLSISFEPNRSIVGGHAYKNLRAVADLLSRHPNTFIYVEGLAQPGEKHPDTDDVAQFRAITAMTYLEIFRVDRTVMELVQPRSAAAERMKEQARKHAEVDAGRSAEERAARAPQPLHGVRFGVVEQH